MAGKAMKLFRSDPVYVVRDANGYFIRDLRFVTAKEPWNASRCLRQARRCPSVNRAIKVGRHYGLDLDCCGFQIRRLRFFGLFSTLVQIVEQGGIHVKKGLETNDTL